MLHKSCRHSILAGAKQAEGSCLQGTDEQEVISVEGEIDRIYVKAPDQLKVSLLRSHQLCHVVFSTLTCLSLWESQLTQIIYDCGYMICQVVSDCV